MMGLILGSLTNVKNVGESNWLVPRFGIAVDDPTLWRSYSDMNHCRLCGQRCQVWTKAFRQELQRDPVNWFPRIAERMEARTLVSSEKSPQSLKMLDPKLENTTVVLFKSPIQHWVSVSKRPWKEQTLRSTMKQWALLYSQFLDDHAYNNKRGKIFLNIENFQEDPLTGLAALTSALGLPMQADALRYWKEQQHYVGGNFNVYERIESNPEKLEVQKMKGEASRKDLGFIRDHEAHTIYLEMTRRSIV
jgi:hypothetical protein